MGARRGERALVVDRRRVQCVRDRLADQRGVDLCGRRGRDVLLGGLRRGTEVGRDDDIVVLEQRRVRRERFLGEDVDRRAGEGAVLDLGGQRVLVDDAAAGAVDEVAVAELIEFGFAD